MKKIIIMLLFISCIMMLGTVSATTITVNPGSSIQNAINSAHTGDTVVVNGRVGYTYKESLYVTKNITVKANANVKVQPKLQSNPALYIGGDGSGATVQNFTFYKSDYMIILSNVNNVNVRSNTLQAVKLVGIQGYGNMTGLYIRGNIIAGMDNVPSNGISFEEGTPISSTITFNSVSKFLNGILFNYANHNNIVSYNIVTGKNQTGAGIYAVHGSTNEQIIGNTVRYYEDGIACEMLTDEVMSGFTISDNVMEYNKNGMWVALVNSLIFNNTATNNIVSGLDITGYNLDIINNTSNYNGICGLAMSGVLSDDNNVISENTFKNNIAGINSESYGCIYSYNIIGDNENYGIIVRANSTLINNIIYNSGTGILLI